MSEATTQRISQPRYTRTSRDQEAAILRLRRLDKTQMEIAAAVGLSQATVSRVLAEFTDSREHALATLHNGANTLAERIVKQANVTESLDVLERLEVIAPKKGSAGGNTGISIVIGMPQSPAGPAPILDLSPSVSPVIHSLTGDTSSSSV